jgi:GT2 family glycosyltransferase
LLFIDDDCIAQPGLLDAHRRTYSDDKTGAVAGFIDDPVFPVGEVTPSWFDITTGELRQHFALPDSGASISIMGANMSFRRDALEAIGGFDARYRQNALWEEIDAAFRLQNAGYPVRYAADARVKHCRSSDGGCRRGGRSAQMFHTFANTAYFAGTYAPRNHLRTWLRFWKYRLEFLARRPVPDHSGKIRHDMRLVAAGSAGILCGCIRYVTVGNRGKLPDTVIEHFRQVPRSCT